MNAVATIKPREGALVTGDQAETIRQAMKASLYPGAADASIDMVLAYCQATGLDPMTKPVHIVPMSVSTGRKDDKGWDVKETRDVVMPGIGLYRINAARTGQYAGCSEPEFGPICSMEVDRDIWGDGPDGRRQKRTVKVSFQYPEWCRVTVRKLLGGQVVEFSAKEYWLENYASKADGGPNAMWEKRAFGQLAKCTEAQALRKAFPEAVGSQPTAEEMEGKDVIDVQATRVPAASTAPALPQELPLYSEADFAENLPKWRALIATKPGSTESLIAKLQTKARFTDEQLQKIRAPAKAEPNPDFPLDEDQEPQA